MSSSGIAGSYGSFMPRFLKNLHAVLIVATSIHKHTHNEILLSLKKEQILDKPRACYTGWSKTESETQLYINHTYMESRKMVLMELLAGQEENHRDRE